MIYYISAQPDEPYFKWQLEVQLLNFYRCGIPAANIHVLISYDPMKGVNPVFLRLAEEQQDKAIFYFYEDNRTDKNYIPSLRPHILKQHFTTHPILNDAYIFYHDCDIIFRELPNFESLCKDYTWYLSDTSSYISVEYIKNIGDIIFLEMCEVMDISPTEIMCTDTAGGAQYLLRGVNYQFWNKVEQDCVKLHSHLTNNRERYIDIFCRNMGIDKSAYHSIQDWCTDMWAILWNGFQLGFNIKTDPELDFCWPAEPLERWKATKILHNSGVTPNMCDRHFYKGNFYNTPPYDIPLDNYDQEKCTVKYVEAIKAYQEHIKTDLADVTFLFLVRIDSPDRLDNLHIVTNFLHKHFKTNILLLEADAESALNDAKLAPVVKKIFVKDDNPYLHRARYHNQLIRAADTPIIAIYDVDVIIAPSQLIMAVEYIRSKQYHVAYPYNGQVISIWENELKRRFSTKLDVRMLWSSTTADTTKAFGGAVLLNKNSYIIGGMENEHIYKWGPDDIERVKRMEILGYDYIRIDGPLYHLFHRRAQNSSYSSSDDYELLMQEYLRISGMCGEELKAEVSQWTWAHSMI
jgi:hypothetical protein